jgi:hypothetical protein
MAAAERRDPASLGFLAGLRLVLIEEYWFRKLADVSAGFSESLSRMDLKRRRNITKRNCHGSCEHSHPV